MEKPVESKTDPLQVVDLPNDAPDQPTTNDQFTHGVIPHARHVPRSTRQRLSPASHEQRSKLLGFSEATYGTATVLGPLIEGALTNKVTWRWVRNALWMIGCLLSTDRCWCLWINLPIGGGAAVVVLVFFQSPENPKPAQASLKEKVLQMDLIGVALMIDLIVSYILALDYGAQTHP
jgi:MFS family permease